MSLITDIMRRSAVKSIVRKEMERDNIKYSHHYEIGTKHALYHTGKGHILPVTEYSVLLILQQPIETLNKWIDNDNLVLTMDLSVKTGGHGLLDNKDLYCSYNIESFKLIPDVYPDIICYLINVDTDSYKYFKLE